MVSAKTLLTYPDQTITFMVHIAASDKQLGNAIINNNKPITLFYVKSIKGKRRGIIRFDKRKRRSLNQEDFLTKKVRNR